MKTTPLGFALIGLTVAQARSGYDLRKVFEMTPLGAYSSSPGSIYPALNKLLAASLIDQRPVKGTTKNVYHPTAKGRAALRKWLTQPVGVQEVAKNIDIALLRFAFLESFDDRKLTQRFLESFGRAVSEHLDDLRRFMNSPAGEMLSPYGKLAMESGIKGFETQLAWAKRAHAAFSEKSD